MTSAQAGMDEDDSGASPLGNVLTRIVPPRADDAFAFMAVWREPAGSDGMMQVTVCKAAATVLRSSFRQVPKVFMSVSGAKSVRWG